MAFVKTKNQAIIKKQGVAGKERNVFLITMLDARCWMLDTGCWMLDIGCWVQV
jgi:hypothetical protein